MKRFLHRFGRFYSRVILNFIGIFIFAGILSVVFGDYGWMPNENMYAISQFVYHCVIPILIAYTAGNEMGYPVGNAKWNHDYAGGTIAVMATAGLLLANDKSGILGAMILGPISGLLWEKLLRELVKKVRTGLEMLARNVVAAIVGSVLAVLAYYLVAPLIEACTDILLFGINYLLDFKLIWLLSFIIEPAKVFFLNNSINHGILLPLGMQQVEEMGESMLFLLEANPGPGLGLLSALYICRKEERSEYGVSLFVEFIGGVHEIYFPQVLSNIWLLLALIGGGAAGNFCFLTFHGAVTGAVSPGSIILVLLVCGRNRMLSVLLGIFVSALVTAILAILILKWQSRGEKNKDVQTKSKMISEIKNEDVRTKSQTISEINMEKKMIIKVGFICNAGVGSSAMGAALFRRKLGEMHIDGVEVLAYPADQLPADLTFAVCQRDFKEQSAYEIKAEKVFTIESLLNQSEYMAIIEEIQRWGE